MNFVCLSGAVEDNLYCSWTPSIQRLPIQRHPLSLHLWINPTYQNWSTDALLEIICHNNFYQRYGLALMIFNPIWKLYNLQLIMVLWNQTVGSLIEPSHREKKSRGCSSINDVQYSMKKSYPTQSDARFSELPFICHSSFVRTSLPTLLFTGRSCCPERTGTRSVASVHTQSLLEYRCSVYSILTKLLGRLLAHTYQVVR